MHKKILTFLFILVVLQSNLQAQDKKYDGKKVYRYPSGKIQLEAQFKNGIPVGKWTFYYENGYVKSTGIVSGASWKPEYEEIILLRNDYPFGSVGSWKNYYPNGKLRSDINVNNSGNIVSGTFFDNQGRIEQKIVPGKIIYYYKNGNIRKIDAQGKTLFFDESGNPIKEEKHRTFLDAIHANSIVFFRLNLLALEYKQDVDRFFTQFRIKKSPENIEEFKKSITSFTYHIASEINGDMSERYASLPQKDLDRYITIAQSDIDLDQKLELTRFNQYFDEFYLKERQKNARLLTKIIEVLKAKDAPLKLRLIIDHDTLLNNKKHRVQMYFVTRNKKYPKVNALNDKTLEIQLPEDLQYNEIDEVLVVYKGKNMSFFNRNKVLEPYKNLPDELVGVFEPFQEQYFTNKTYWILQIDHNQTETGKHEKSTGEEQESEKQKIGTYIKFTIDETEQQFLSD